MYDNKLRVVAYKVAMTAMPFNGELFGCTIIKFVEPYVTCIKKENNKIVYTMGIFKIEDCNKFSGRFLALKQHGLHDKFHNFYEVHISDRANGLVAGLLNESYSNGKPFRVLDVLKVKSSIDVIGLTIGKGFCGVMKRFGFGGLPASHGTSATHRSVGSTGSRIPKHTFKGRPMPGRDGNKLIYVRNLQVVKLLSDENVIVVKGSVPGFNGSALYLISSVIC